MMVWIHAVRSLILVGLVAANSREPTNAQSVNLWRLQSSRDGHGRVVPPEYSIAEHLQAPFGSSSEFAERWFEQPLDHFDSNDHHTFKQRYWANTRHYKPGGPVFVLDGGETSGTDRLPFLDTGIAEILPKATNGIGIVLEHRYYGQSIPVANFSTDSMRWLNNAQSAADSANFMKNVEIDGIREDITAPSTRWIYYGGSYAGARAAHMRVLYPDIVYGAIASSGVTHATLENWEYNEIIRLAAEPQCSKNLENAIQAIDHILMVPALRKPLKSIFGLGDLEHDDDFASLLERPLGAWQAKNWDPKVGSTRFEAFCAALAKPLFEHDELNLYSADGSHVPVSLVVWNYAKYIKENYVSRCPDGATVEECFGSYDDAKFQDTSLTETWRAWLFQVCTEWGYFSAAPPNITQPRIVSRLVTLETSSRICQQAFLPGKHFSVPSLPNVTVVNELGDFTIAADRLAIIDGEVDPWRPATPHSTYAPNRDDTINQPFKLIPGGVHHWDENGLRNMDDEPADILKIHKEVIGFVRKWLEG